MIILNKENMVSYLREYAPSVLLKDPVSVAMIGINSVYFSKRKHLFIN